MSDNDILFERRGAAGIVTLNRPKALNAVTHGMALALRAQLDRWANDDAVRSRRAVTFASFMISANRDSTTPRCNSGATNTRSTPRSRTIENLTSH